MLGLTPRHLVSVPLEVTMGRWLLGGGVVLLTLCSAPLNAQEPNWALKFSTNSPPGRFLHAMAYDAAHGQTVLFGGNNAGSDLSDTWMWDGTNWTQKSPANVPPARYGHTMAYDTVRGQVVLFGGLS